MTSDTRANIALLVSISSLLISAAGFVINTFRDRPRLKISSVLYSDDDGRPDKIAVSVVNKGRRPVILRKIGGNGRKGGAGWTYFDSKGGGIRLGENEHHEFETTEKGLCCWRTTALMSPTISCGLKIRLATGTRYRTLASTSRGCIRSTRHGRQAVRSPGRAVC